MTSCRIFSLDVTEETVSGRPTEVSGVTGPGLGTESTGPAQPGVATTSGPFGVLVTGFSGTAPTSEVGTAGYTTRPGAGYESAVSTTEPPCPYPYLMDYKQSQETAVSLILIKPDGTQQQLGHEALAGSPGNGVAVPAMDKPFTLLFRVDQPCERWQILGFKVKVVGVDTLTAKVGKYKSKPTQVCFSLQF